MMKIFPRTSYRHRFILVFLILGATILAFFWWPSNQHSSEFLRGDSIDTALQSVTVLPQQLTLDPSRIFFTPTVIYNTAPSVMFVPVQNTNPPATNQPAAVTPPPVIPPHDAATEKPSPVLQPILAPLAPPPGRHYKFGAPAPALTTEPVTPPELPVEPQKQAVVMPPKPAVPVKPAVPESSVKPSVQPVAPVSNPMMVSMDVDPLAPSPVLPPVIKAIEKGISLHDNSSLVFEAPPSQLSKARIPPIDSAVSSSQEPPKPLSSSDASSQPLNLSSSFDAPPEQSASQLTPLKNFVDQQPEKVSQLMKGMKATDSVEVKDAVSIHKINKHLNLKGKVAIPYAILVAELNSIPTQKLSSTADQQGAWSIASPGQLQDGIHTVDIVAMDSRDFSKQVRIPKQIIFVEDKNKPIDTRMMSAYVKDLQQIVSNASRGSLEKPSLVLYVYPLANPRISLGEKFEVSLLVQAKNIPQGTPLSLTAFYVDRTGKQMYHEAIDYTSTRDGILKLPISVPEDSTPGIYRFNFQIKKYDLVANSFTDFQIKDGMVGKISAHDSAPPSPDQKTARWPLIIFVLGMMGGIILLHKRRS